MFKRHHIHNIADIAISLNDGNIVVIIGANNSVIIDTMRKIEENGLSTEEIKRQEIECGDEWISALYLISALDSFDKNKLKQFCLATLESDKF